MSPRDPAAAAPRRPDIGLVILAGDPWSRRRMARHQLAARLTRHFHVVWVNPAIPWRAVPGVALDRLQGRGPDGPGPGDPIVHPAELWLPKFLRPDGLVRSIQARRVRRATAHLDRLGCTRRVLYVWWPFPHVLDHGMTFDLTCYHLSDEYSFSPDDGPVPDAEQRLLTGADQVFIHSRALMEKKGHFNPHTAWLPNGVDYAAFAEPCPVPADLVPIPRPWIGYTGNLKNVLDWEMLRSLIDARPDRSFVFVGARKNLGKIGHFLEELDRRPNAFFLGEKTSQELAAYPQHFDVCVMPYRLNGYTKYIYPLKLHEYLAGGRPVVGSPVPALEEFAPVIELATTAEEWSQALDRALAAASMTQERRTERQQIAAGYDWDRLVERLAARLLERLEDSGSRAARPGPVSVETAG